ncbi:MAG: orotidine-5'-phosphate decarboxylase [Deltaproteobacteria bacterium]|jgi:orotidine-5'-phosphate decarboxylase|nr:orotidine-5'-phosphate decarboxylase [Deltaproteobacteria bacterium]
MRAELVVALDLRDAEEALRLAGKLIPVTPWMKVGLELFILGGAPVIAKLKGMGGRVFLDLKFHDIPHTVGRAVAAAARAGADMCDVHMDGGEAMCRAAVLAAKNASEGGFSCRLLGVTVLTSTAPAEAPGGDLQALAADYARKAADWGLDGLVCSGHEAGAVKRASGGALFCLCPGIRPAGAAENDQKRVCTPPEAARAGADFLVVGRPVTEATDPVRAALDIVSSYTQD